MKDLRSCPICASQAFFIGKKAGRLDNREYLYFHCSLCRFSFISNPRNDYGTIYSEHYYKGLGADPMVNYLYELEKPAVTIRNYEWQGLLSIFNSLLPNGGRWLDFGCGCGGQVALAKKNGIDICGFEEGWGAQAGRLKGIPILTTDELKGEQGRFDFVSAIEVIEHTADPLNVLRQIRSVLKPGGILFLTTGNSKPWRGRILDWPYASVPEVHISFFEPESLAVALNKAGFEVRQGFYLSGFASIIKYKVLKNMGIKNKNIFVNMLPWTLISRIVDIRHQVSKLPMGVVPK